MYNDKSILRIFNLIRVLLKIDFTEFGKMDEYVLAAKFLSLSQKLADIENPVLIMKLIATSFLAIWYFVMTT